MKFFSSPKFKCQKIRDSGDVDGAIALHRRISLLDPDMVANLHALGNLLLVEKGDRIESEMLFRRALVLAPTFPELHHSLSAVFCTIASKEAARKCLDVLDHAVTLMLARLLPFTKFSISSIFFPIFFFNYCSLVLCRRTRRWPRGLLRLERVFLDISKTIFGLPQLVGSVPWRSQRRRAALS